jgi:hypothetical protein
MQDLILKFLPFSTLGQQFQIINDLTNPWPQLMSEDQTRERTVCDLPAGRDGQKILILRDEETI